MNTKTFHNPHRFFPVFFVFLFALVTGCANTPNLAPGYTVTCKKSASFEMGKPIGYDPELGGYWLTGNEATISLNPKAANPDGSPVSGGPLVLSVRTASGSGTPSTLSFLRIATPQYRITTRFQEQNILRVETMEDASRTDLLRDMGYVRILQDGKRVKIVLSDDFLRRYAPSGAALTWWK
jgi:hypothetical protein